jgi:hypothetical protein
MRQTIAVAELIHRAFEVRIPPEPTSDAGIKRQILSISKGDADRASLAARGVQLLAFPPLRLMR